MILFKYLLFNLLFILITSFTVQYFFTKRQNTLQSEHKKWVIAIAAVIQIIFCINFSYTEDQQFFYDLRVIPVVLGGLFGGVSASIYLFFLSLLVRVPLGGIGIWLHVAMMLFITFTVSYLSKNFHTFSLIKKLVLVTGITASYGGTFVTLKSFIEDKPFDSSLSGTFLLTLIAGMVIVLFLIELILQNTILSEAIIKSDKNEAISHLAASVSHEVRNPLTVTRGFLQLLKDSSIPEHKRQFYLNTAIDELDRAEIILSDYLSFSKPHNNHVSQLNVKTEMEKSIELLLPYANHNSVKVNQQLQDNLYILGDATKFQQCLLNIMKNGIEAMANGGVLRIEAKSSSSKQTVIIHIIDSGVGMSHTQLAKLGEPYFSTKAEKGTGLGMMVAYKILREMGGNLKATSHLNKGTQFSLTFPTLELPHKN
ncbi:ATP-binding protein [Mesobacillus maritimus]|uniref:ATP-binding protein n=1 Tax=Mesobacillus maritimus TaxID=1643336 RepID=UPI00203E33FE|nr:ATP-binding protein [Mesobacillus maritimus]MCM3586018.1 ATP-binding protein [Mesobacillus maritimus]